MSIPGSDRNNLKVVRRERIDRVLMERGIIQSRERAKALIMAGRVKVGDGRLINLGREWNWKPRSKSGERIKLT